MVTVPVAEPVEVIEVLAEGTDREGDEEMTQDEKWHVQYDEVVAFINKNHRNPSKYVNEERGLVNWCKRQRKIINAGEMRPERQKLFEVLQGLMEKYKRVNQYQLFPSVTVVTEEANYSQLRSLSLPKGKTIDNKSK